MALKSTLTLSPRGMAQVEGLVSQLLPKIGALQKQIGNAAAGVVPVVRLSPPSSGEQLPSEVLEAVAKRLSAEHGLLAFVLAYTGQPTEQKAPPAPRPTRARTEETTPDLDVGLSAQGRSSEEIEDMLFGEGGALTGEVHHTPRLVSDPALLDTPLEEGPKGGDVAGLREVQRKPYRPGSAEQKPADLSGSASDWAKATLEADEKAGKLKRQQERQAKEKRNA